MDPKLLEGINIELDDGMINGEICKEIVCLEPLRDGEINYHGDGTHRVYQALMKCGLDYLPGSVFYHSHHHHHHHQKSLGDKITGYFNEQAGYLTLSSYTPMKDADINDHKQRSHISFDSFLQRQIGEAPADHGHPARGRWQEVIRVFPGYIRGITYWGDMVELLTKGLQKQDWKGYYQEGLMDWPECEFLPHGSMLIVVFTSSMINIWSFLNDVVM